MLVSFYILFGVMIRPWPLYVHMCMQDEEDPEHEEQLRQLASMGLPTAFGSNKEVRLGLRVL